MIDTDEIEQNGLDKLMQMDKPEEFGPIFVQRNLRVGYNLAMNILELGIEKRVLEAASVPGRYRVKPVVM